MTADPTISAGQRVALQTSARRLSAEFPAIFGATTPERILHSSYDAIAQTSAPTRSLPLLAERFARQRLQALARINGHARGGKPVVLFLSVRDADRSQMALGFFTRSAGDNAIAWSGGSKPAAAITEVAVAVMAEKGIDISGEFPKPRSDEVVRAADLVVAMGHCDSCPIFLGKWNQEWVLDDPSGQDVEAVRPIRDDIERRVESLLKEIGVPATSQR